MINEYFELKGAVEAAGYFTDFQPIDEPGDRIVLASKAYASGPQVGGLGGNSFWVATRNGHWYVASWAPAIYRMPHPERLLELCLNLLRRKEARAYGDFAERIRADFGLVAVSEHEFDSPSSA